MSKILVFLFQIITSVSIAKEMTSDQIFSLLQTSEAKFNSGQFNGLIIDQSIKRPAEIVFEGIDQDYIYVKNFYSQKKFWLAKIKKNSVKQIKFQLALFSPLLIDPFSSFQLAHGQLRFNLIEPLTMYRINEYGKLVQNQTSDVIFSIEAALPSNLTYDLVPAIKGDYKIVGRLINSFDRMKKEQEESGDFLTEYDLINISFDQSNKIFETALEYSSIHLFDKKYEASTANCINELVDIIDMGLNQYGKYPRIELTIENMTTNGLNPNEVMTIEALKKRNLLPLNKKLSDINFRKIIDLN